MIKNELTEDTMEFAKQVVGETVLAILSADCSRFTVTTYDKEFVDGVKSAVIDAVRNHWEFK